ncbi:ParB N-terminal domain-containing protein [Sphingomonas paucimobilis]|uniref:ParB N-terminal domain-containing protein n=2 Tax=Sphingomonas paucimobilis TaxID=13689 RepID=UPI003B968E6D
MTAPLHEEALASFILIRTDEIDAVDRLRPVDAIWAEALGQVMARDGQDTPIQVCRLPGKNRWTLVAGAHRLEGAKTAAIEYLKAEVVSADRDDRRLREVRENLWRSDLTPVDRAAFIAEAVAIHKRRAGIDPTADGRIGSITARWQKPLKMKHLIQPQRLRLYTASQTRWLRNWGSPRARSKTT